jgi:hypothetical protein
VRFNPAEPDVFATTGSDRGIALYDLRSSTPIRKLVMQTRTNAIAWNPMEPFNFTGGWLLLGAAGCWWVLVGCVCWSVGLCVGGGGTRAATSHWEACRLAVW